MPTTTPWITTGAEQVVLERGALRVELVLLPFAMTVRRLGRRLLRSGGLWVADGTIHDLFVQFTEGVVPREERSPAQRALRASVSTHAAWALGGLHRECLQRALDEVHPGHGGAVRP